MTILSLASRLLRRMLVQSARSTGGSGAIPFSSRQEHQSPAGIQIRPARRRRPRIRPPRATSRQSSSEAEASRLRSLSALRSHSAPPRRGWGNAEDLVCVREAAASFVFQPNSAHERGCRRYCGSSSSACGGENQPSAGSDEFEKRIPLRSRNSLPALEEKHAS